MDFKNCTEAYKAGRSNIPKGDPAYSAKLDADHDGIGCDNPPAGFKPVQNTNTGTIETGSGTGTALPKTGPAAEVGGIGAALLVIGVAAVAVRRRNRVRFTA